MQPLLPHPTQTHPLRGTLHRAKNRTQTQSSASFQPRAGHPGLRLPLPLSERQRLLHSQRTAHHLPYPPEHGPRRPAVPAHPRPSRPRSLRRPQRSAHGPRCNLRQ
jgi:hypothetical protein